MKKTLFIIAFILCFIACDKKEKEAEQTSQPNEPTNQAQLSVNYYTPFNLYFIDGSTFALQKTKYGFNFDSGGMPVLFSFVSNDCPPCKSQSLYLNKLAKKRKDIRIITILLEDTDQNGAIAYKEENSLITPVAFGDNAFFFASAALEEVKGIPFTLIYNKNGELVQNYDGFMPPEMLEYDIERAM